jgi:hypothetical protein
MMEAATPRWQALDGVLQQRLDDVQGEAYMYRTRERCSPYRVSRGAWIHGQLRPLLRRDFSNKVAAETASLRRRRSESARRRYRRLPVLSFGLESTAPAQRGTRVAPERRLEPRQQAPRGGPSAPMVRLPSLEGTRRLLNRNQILRPSTWGRPSRLHHHHHSSRSRCCWQARRLAARDPTPTRQNT